MPEFKRKALQGVFPLMPLPIKANEEIDYDALEWNIDWLEQKGIHGFIALGCMGAFNAVSEAEFAKVCDVCVNAAKGKKIACVVSSTQLNTREVVRRVQYAEQAGADGSMAALPFAWEILKEEAMDFLQTLNSAVKGEMALMLYNTVALQRGFSVSAEMWEKSLLKLENIKAVKDSDMRIHNHDMTILTIADKVNWLSCGDSFFWHDSMCGGKGIVGQLTWVAPKTLVKFYNECMKKNFFDPWVLEVQKALIVGFGAISLAQNGMPPMSPYEHAYLNALAEIGGAKAGNPRKPYSPLPKDVGENLEKAVQPLLELEKRM